MSQNETRRLVRGPYPFPSEIAARPRLVRSFPAVCVLSVVCALASFASAARDGYRPGDWVSWNSMRRVNEVQTYEHILYVAYDGGVGRYDVRDRTWLRPLTISDGLIERDIRALEIDPGTTDLVYLTATGRIAAFTLYNEKPNPFYRPSDAIRAELERTVESGATYPPSFAPAGYAFSSEGILSDWYFREYETIDAVVDFWDNLWLAIRGFGVAVRDRVTAQLVLLPYSLWSDNLRAIDSFGDTFWFVGEEAINVHHRDLDAWARFEPISEPRILSADVADVLVESTEVWLATREGLSRYDGRTSEWRTFIPHDGLPDEQVTALASESASVWIGTAFGVGRYDRATRRITNVSPPGGFPERTINDIAVAAGEVWIATANGILRTADRGAHWIRWTGGESILDAESWRIEPDGDRMLWFATARGVAGAEIANARWERYPMANYFSRGAVDPNAVGILSLQPAGNLIWVGTDHGLYRGDRRRGYWRMYTTEDGLIDDAVTDIELDEDYVWFATPRGVTRFFWNDARRVD